MIGLFGSFIEDAVSIDIIPNTQEVISLGRGHIRKFGGTCEGNFESAMEINSSLDNSKSLDKESAKSFLFPGTCWGWTLKSLSMQRVATLVEMLVLNGSAIISKLFLKSQLTQLLLSDNARMLPKILELRCE